MHKVNYLMDFCRRWLPSVEFASTEDAPWRRKGKRENSCEGCPQSSGNRKLLETRLPAGKRRRLVCVIDGPCHIPVDFELICFSFLFFSFLFLLLFLFWISIFMLNFTQFDLGRRHARTCPGLSSFSIWHLTFDVASSSRHTLSCLCS